MPDLSNLSFQDVVSILLPFLATVLAVWNEARTSAGAPGSRFTFKLSATAYGALLLGTAGVVLAAVNTSEAYEAGKKETAWKEDISNQIKEALPGVITSAVMESKGEITRAMQTTVADSQEHLRTALTQTTLDTTKQLQQRLGETIKGSQGDLEKALGGSIDAVGASIKTSVATGLQDSQAEVDKVVKSATSQAALATTQAVEKAATDTNRRTEEAVLRNVHAMILQIPLQIPENSSRGLIGPLSGLTIEVGEVSDKRPFPVWVRDGARELAQFTVVPDRRNKAKTHSHRLTYQGVEFQFDMIIDTPSNWLGESPDSLLCYILMRQPSGGVSIAGAASPSPPRNE